MSPTQTQSAGSEASELSKIPIHSLLSHEDLPQKPPHGARCRVKRACVYCRAQKTKCDGGHPRCKRCAENDADCVYAPSRSDKLKSITKRNQEMILLLHELRDHVSVEDAQKIEGLLADVEDDVADIAATVFGTTPIPWHGDRPKNTGPDKQRGEQTS